MSFMFIDFYGKTSLEEAYIDLILETLQDLAYAARPYILENKQNTAKKVNFNNIYPTCTFPLYISVGLPKQKTGLPWKHCL